MGGGSYSSSDWASYSSSKGFDHKAPEEVINRSGVDEDFLPTSFKNGKRESRDSADNPTSTPIIVAGDVTGSMGRLAGLLIKKGLSDFAAAIYDRKPVTNPHIMGMAIGDAECDDVPIQCTQFEADIRIIQQFEKLYVEGRGGGNRYESYHLPWIVAALMTSHDAWEKRGQKGVLFTYGDEETPAPISASLVKKFLGIDVQDSISAEDALAMVRRTYDVYHLIILEGAHASSYPDRVKSVWTELLGQSAIPVSDYHKVPEIMTSILQVRAGLDKDSVSDSWSKETSLVVRSALRDLTTPTNSSETGLVTL